MARVLKGSHSFTCTPRIHPLAEWTIPAFAFQAEAGTHLRPRRDGRLSWPWLTKPVSFVFLHLHLFSPQNMFPRNFPFLSKQTLRLRLACPGDISLLVPRGASSSRQTDRRTDRLIDQTMRSGSMHMWPAQCQRLQSNLLIILLAYIPRLLNDICIGL